jgi:hypothetical protein|tara:strand:- start:16743 stop:17291 length:549 start_codon:yes stop_codon:yes gene_type:complete
MTDLESRMAGIREVLEGRLGGKEIRSREVFNVVLGGIESNFGRLDSWNIGHAYLVMFAIEEYCGVLGLDRYVGVESDYFAREDVELSEDAVVDIWSAVELFNRFDEYLDGRWSDDAELNKSFAIDYLRVNVGHLEGQRIACLTGKIVSRLERRQRGVSNATVNEIYIGGYSGKQILDAIRAE